jgi:hypothetical protein
MHILTRAGEYSDLCFESFGSDIFLIRGGCCFLFVSEVLAIFLGLVVIWADDILRIERHLAVKAETNRAVLF